LIFVVDIFFFKKIMEGIGRNIKGSFRNALFVFIPQGFHIGPITQKQPDSPQHN